VVVFVGKVVWKKQPVNNVIVVNNVGKVNKPNTATMLMLPIWIKTLFA
jgi:hypothetical protein